MKRLAAVMAIVALCVAGIVAAEEEKPAAPASYSQNFDASRAGTLPAGWKVEATGPRGELAVWKVVADDKAPSAPNVLSITKINDTSDGVFNLCWTNKVKFKDGTITAKVRANSGKTDQGGGLMWGATDAGNYHVVRYNPREKNFRLYVVKDGVRRMLADAKDLGVKAGEWFTIKVVQKGAEVVCSLNDKELLRGAAAEEAGGVGFWTKADAASSFDDFEVVGE